MVTLRIEFNSPYQLELPNAKKHRDLLALGQAFMRYENTLPTEERTPKTGEINTLVLELRGTHQRAQAAEIERKKSSEALKRTETNIRQLIRMAQNILTATFANEPEQAQAWGFIVRQTGPSAGRILLPSSREEILECVDRYIVMEETRPTTERFTLPPYDLMVNARASLIQHLQEREKYLNLRKQANAEALQLARQLRIALKQALSHLIIYRCNGDICHDLTNWGFRITNRPTSAIREDVVDEMAAAPA